MTYISCIKALSNDSRRTIVEGLRHGPLSVGELAGQMTISQPAVSQHLKVLAEAGLVHCQNQGARHLYSVKPEGMDELRRYIESYWDVVLDAYSRSTEPGDGHSDPENEEKS